MPERREFTAQVVAMDGLLAYGLEKVTEAARVLWLGKSKVYDLMNTGELPHILIGRSRMIA